MALEEKVEAVKKVSQAMKSQPTPELDNIERVPPDKERFQILMDPGQQNVAQQQTAKIEQEAVSVNKVNQTSIMDEMKKLNTKVKGISKMSPEDLRNQAQDVIAQIDKVKGQLSNPDAKVNPAYHNVLRNRLTHIDDSLKIALSKAGVEYKAAPPSVGGSGKGNPVVRFIGLLTDSQARMGQLMTSIEQLQLTKEKLTPAAMLGIQMKIGLVQQQLELFTSALNKALESTKTIMNVQV